MAWLMGTPRFVVVAQGYYPDIGLKYFTTKRVAEDVAPLSGSDKYFLV
jgi:hypothetical protein